MKNKILIYRYKFISARRVFFSQDFSEQNVLQKIKSGPELMFTRVQKALDDIKSDPNVPPELKKAINKLDGDQVVRNAEALMEVANNPEKAQEILAKADILEVQLTVRDKISEKVKDFISPKANKIGNFFRGLIRRMKTPSIAGTGIVGGVTPAAAINFSEIRDASLSAASNVSNTATVMDINSLESIPITLVEAARTEVAHEDLMAAQKVENQGFIDKATDTVGNWVHSLGESIGVVNEKSSDAIPDILPDASNFGASEIGKLGGENAIPNGSSEGMFGNVNALVQKGQDFLIAAKDNLPTNPSDIDLTTWIFNEVVRYTAWGVSEGVNFTLPVVVDFTNGFNLSAFQGFNLTNLWSIYFGLVVAGRSRTRIDFGDSFTKENASLALASTLFTTLYLSYGYGMSGNNAALISFLTHYLCKKVFRERRRNAMKARRNSKELSPKLTKKISRYLNPKHIGRVTDGIRFKLEQLGIDINHNKTFFDIKEDENDRLKSNPISVGREIFSNILLSRSFTIDNFLKKETNGETNQEIISNFIKFIAKNSSNNDFLKQLNNNVRGVEENLVSRIRDGSITPTSFTTDLIEKRVQYDFLNQGVELSDFKHAVPQICDNLINNIQVFMQDYDDDNTDPSGDVDQEELDNNQNNSNSTVIINDYRQQSYSEKKGDTFSPVTKKDFHGITEDINQQKDFSFQEDYDYKNNYVYYFNGKYYRIKDNEVSLDKKEKPYNVLILQEIDPETGEDIENSTTKVTEANWGKFNQKQKVQKALETLDVIKKSYQETQKQKEMQKAIKEKNSKPENVFFEEFGLKEGDYFEMIEAVDNKTVTLNMLLTNITSNRVVYVDTNNPSEPKGISPQVFRNRVNEGTIIFTKKKSKQKTEVKEQEDQHKKKKKKLSPPEYQIGGTGITIKNDKTAKKTGESILKTVGDTAYRKAGIAGKTLINIIANFNKKGKDGKQ